MSGMLFTTSKGDLVYRGPYDTHVVEAIKEVPGRMFDRHRKEWVMPLTKDAVNALQDFQNIKITNEVYVALQIQEESQEMARLMKEEEKPKPLEPMLIKAEPFAHQIIAFNIALKLTNAGLLHEQGCGKTLSAIAVVGARWNRGEIKRVLIVAPLSVIPVWEYEFEKFADYPFNLQALVGNLQNRIKQLQPKKLDELHVVVTNYEAVWRRGLLQAILKWKPDMVICDESQKIKGPKTKQSKGMHMIGDYAEYKMILTGTPVTATPMDFWSQYRFLQPNIFGKFFYAFRNRYAQMGGWQNKQVVGYKNKNELITKAHSIAHRVTKAEALDLPEQIDQNLFCELEPKAFGAYREMVNLSVAEMEEYMKDVEVSERQHKVVASNVLTRLLRLQQMVGGFVNTEESGSVQISSAKLNLLKETVADILQSGKKVVIFARFIPEINAIINMLEENDFGVGDFKHAYIMGSVPTNSKTEPTRGDKVLEFQTDPDCKVFIAQIQTAGLGITLHAASTSIFYSADFNYANYDQCRARLHRIGQRNVVNHIHLIVQNTVDEKIYKALAEKKSIADDVVDNWRAYLK